MASWQKIKLSAAIFGHISQGLYRSPAGAIKELISNSFDADATLVKIHTGFPAFERFSCEDNGDGMPRGEFDRLMERGIGTSFKRTMESTISPRFNRPVIGRLGIGILALAQVCSEFTLISHAREERSAFRATLRFLPYTKQEIEKLLKQRRGSGDNTGFIEGGEYLIEDIEYDPDRIGVRIFTDYLRETFRKRMRNLKLLRPRVSGRSPQPYPSFEAFLAGIYRVEQSEDRALVTRSDYDQLIFGLAVAAPVPYLEGDRGNVTLQTPFVRAYQRALKSYSFAVEVDNLKLAKPLYFPSDRQKHSAAACSVGTPTREQVMVVDGSVKESVDVLWFPIRVRGEDVSFRLYEMKYFNQNVAGRPLGFSGYIFQQVGRLYPKDIQGSLVRIRNVAIGTYDPGLMFYPLAEGPRYSMVSTEFLIEKGFEDALNIDRDSFNQLDAHYIRLQSYFHHVLHDLVFPKTWGEEKRRNRERREAKSADAEATFVRTLRKLTRHRYVRIRRPQTDGKVSIDDPPVRFLPRTIEVNMGHPLLRRSIARRRYRQLAERIIIAFERASLERDPTRRRELFYTLLQQILQTR